MNFDRTGRFKKAYRQLSQQDQRRVDKALGVLAENPLHPSLHTEKVVDDIWSIRVSDRLRCSFEFAGDLEELRHADAVTLCNVGYHDEVYRSP